MTQTRTALAWQAAAAVVVAASGTAVLLTASPPAASLADPLCQDVKTSGTLIGSHEVGPKCVNYPNARFCEVQTVGLDPKALVTVTACVPAPVSARD